MELGCQGELIAANYLISKQYKIVEKNFRCKMGEIDIIAYQGRTLVFVEVKTRSNTSYGFPCEAVNHKKRIHLIRTATYYMVKNQITDVDQRMDVIEILYNSKGVYIRHLTNAFDC